MPEPAHHSLAVGSALHQAVAAFNLSRKRGRPLDESTLVGALDAHWSGEGFHSRAHEERRYDAARQAVLRFRAEDLVSGRPRADRVESAFRVDIEGVAVEGRLDRLDRGPDGIVVTDYKSGDIRDVARARQRARESLQLAVYALAVEATEGRGPDVLQLHFLEPGIVGSVPVEASRLDAARSRIRAVSEGVQAGDFEARPDPFTCRGCPFRRVCPSAAA